MHIAEKVRDTTLDEDKYDVRYSQQRQIGQNMTDGTLHFTVIMVLCIQPEDFALDLGDNQSRYLSLNKAFLTASSISNLCMALNDFYVLVCR